MSKKIKDPMGDRFKKYEGIYKNSLMPRGYSIIRIDGKAFHTYTKGLEQPFDNGLIQDMDETAAYLCRNIMGAKMAFVQSDEISIVVTDFDKIETQAWFDNDVQKMVSISASMATAKFNQLRTLRKIKEDINYVKDYNNDPDTLLEFNMGGTIEVGIENLRLAEFDSRAFQVPNKNEVLNYLIWRQKDTVRNSISSVAQSLYSHKELEGISSNGKQELIFQKGINWNDYPASLKRGRFIRKVQKEISEGVIRNEWISEGSPDFLKDRTLFDEVLIDM